MLLLLLLLPILVTGNVVEWSLPEYCQKDSVKEFGVSFYCSDGSSK